MQRAAADGDRATRDGLGHALTRGNDGRAHAARQRPGRSGWARRRGTRTQKKGQRRRTVLALRAQSATKSGSAVGFGCGGGGCVGGVAVGLLPRAPQQHGRHRRRAVRVRGLWRVRSTLLMHPAGQKKCRCRRGDAPAGGSWSWSSAARAPTINPRKGRKALAQSDTRRRLRAVWPQVHQRRERCK